MRKNVVILPATYEWRSDNTMYTPCSEPQMAKVQLAPCQSPLRTNTTIRL